MSIPYNIYRDPPPTVLHAKYYWQNVPEVIKANETVTLQLKQEVIENTNGGYFIGILPEFYLDAAVLDLGFSTAWRVRSTGVYEDGQATKRPGIGYNQDVQAQSDYTATFSLQALEEGMIGDQFALFTTLYVGGPGSIGVKYIYEWQEIENDVEPGVFTWQGQWESSFGDLTLTQNDSIVTGTYSHDSGQVSGTVSGNKFIGTWSEDPTYAPPYDAGDFEWTMSEDGKKFTGVWRFGSTGNWGSWDGIRVSELTPQPTDDWTQFNEKSNIAIDHEWTVRFSDIATQDKISAIYIEKDGVTLPIDVRYLNTNEIKIEALNEYEYGTRYIIKILLTNGKHAYMYFNTVAQPVVDEIIWDNGNIYAVQNGPVNPTFITLEEDRFITTITNYHYFNYGALPGTISLVGEDGVVYGPWQATGRAGQGNVANANWDVAVNRTLKAGVYKVIDSDPSTWSHNSVSDYTGFTLIKGY